MCIQDLHKKISGADTIIENFSVVVDPSNEVRSDVWADFTFNVPCSPRLYPELNPDSMGVSIGIIESGLQSFLRKNLESMMEK